MIPFVDLQGQYRRLKPEIETAIGRVLENAQFVLGPAVEGFERDFSAYCDVSHTVAVNTGTSALHVALLAAGIGPGDEVITVPFTFVATVAAIEYAGAKPVFVDIDPDYYTMDPINEIARRHKLIVIEDACQAHGAEYKGRRAGSLADIGCFSFYPGKNLGAYGEGGASVTSQAQYADTMRLLRSWGERNRYEHTIRAFNYRMDGIQGAILGVKLKHLETWTEARRRLATTYGHLLAGTPARTPKERPDVRHVYHVYAVRLEQRDRWRARLTEMGIQTGVHYPVPIHLQPAYRDLGYAAGDFPVAEAVAREVLSLPFFPEMTDQQVEEVAGALRAGLPEKVGSVA